MAGKPNPFVKATKGMNPFAKNQPPMKGSKTAPAKGAAKGKC